MRKVFVKTYGCQLNVYDSQKILGIMAQRGFEEAQSMDEADVILFNTCSVRQHAEERVFGKVGELKEIKEHKPGLVVGVMGCMAQRHKQMLFDRMPHLDIVCGTGNLFEIGYLVDEAINKKKVVAAVDKLEREIDSLPIVRSDPYSAYVTIMEGCNNNCSYCIVPYVRGQERSRRPQSILNEIKALVDAGYKEVTLLGQNVNSYGKDLRPLPEPKIKKSRKVDMEKIDAMIEGTYDKQAEVRREKEKEDAKRNKPPALDDRKIDFVGLLRLIDKTKIPRVRFVTSHPKDAKEAMFKAMGRLKSVCECLHMPLQSGSDKILDIMNRQYKVSDYTGKADALRKIIPDAALSTDIIVGFPTETEKDFKKTCDALSDIKFDSAFIFKYSPRPPAKSAQFRDDVPLEAKERRLSELIGLQAEVSLNKNKTLIGRRLEVLVSGPSKKGNGQLTGRTRTNKIVVFSGEEGLIGNFTDVEIIEASAYTLKGKLVKK